MTSAGALRPAPTTVPGIGPDLQAARSFERTASALARSVAAATDQAAPAEAAVGHDDLGAELRGSLLLILAVLLPALVAMAALV